MFIQASIGRNVAHPTLRSAVNPAQPMGDTEWETFQVEVEYQIKSALLDSGVMADTSDLDFQFHTGMGEWGGVKEESAHVSVYFDHDGLVWDDEMAAWKDLKPMVRTALAARLSYLAFQYGQDAIAFVVTDSHLAAR